jgi:hypothetical protein
MSVAAALEEKIEKAWWQMLRNYVLQQEEWPLYIKPGKKLPNNFAERNRELEALYQRSSHHHPHGYIVVEAQTNKRRDGLQSEPVAYYFQSRQHLLAYLNRQDDFEAFATQVQSTLDAFPQLRPWLAAHIKTVIAHIAIWPHVLQVLHYFAANPLPQVYIRQISLPGIDTKFIEQHKKLLYTLLDIVLPPEARFDAYSGVAQFEQRFGLQSITPMIHLRWLHPQQAHAYTGGLQSLSVPISDLQHQHWQVPRVFVVENKVPFLHFEQYIPHHLLPGSLLIFGSGKAVSLLAGCAWLAHSRLLYWGDIDAEGFEILNQLLVLCPHALPVCMDAATWQHHEHTIVSGSGAAARPLPQLPITLTALYEHVCATNQRIEQERIETNWVKQEIEMLCV